MKQKRSPSVHKDSCTCATCLTKKFKSGQLVLKDDATQPGKLSAADQAKTAPGHAAQISGQGDRTVNAPAAAQASSDTDKHVNDLIAILKKSTESLPESKPKEAEQLTQSNPVPVGTTPVNPSPADPAKKPGDGLPMPPAAVTAPGAAGAVVADPVMVIDLSAMSDTLISLPPIACNFIGSIAKKSSTHAFDFSADEKSRLSEQFRIVAKQFGWDIRLSEKYTCLLVFGGMMLVTIGCKLPDFMAELESEKAKHVADVKKP